MQTPSILVSGPEDDSQQASAESPERPLGYDPVLDAFTDREVRYFRKMFDLFDTDNSGAIGFFEMKNMCKHLGVELADDVLRKSMQETDENGNGELEFDEFLHWLAGVSGKTKGGTAAGQDAWAVLKSKIRAKGARPLTNKQIEEFRLVFNHFDADGSGTIDTDELRNVFNDMGMADVTEADIQDLMANVDDDCSGEIDFDEFLMLMCTGFSKSGGMGDDGTESIDEHLLKKFHEYDGTRSGLISAVDLEDALSGLVGSQMPGEELADIVRCFAAERGDGYVDYVKWETLWDACGGVAV